MPDTLFLDTSCFIYLVEKNPDNYPKIQKIFRQIEIGKVEAKTSIITMTECLVMPYKIKNMDLVNKYQVLFNDFPNLKLLTPSQFTAIKSAEISANFNLKLPDSYQLALALESGCQIFLTNDKSLESFPDLKIDLISNP